MFLLFFSDWDVQRVKVWAKALFNDEGIARKFEEEEIEGRTLQSERILSDASMDNLGLSTIGKKDKFATAVQDLFGKFIKVTIMIIQSAFIFVVSSSSAVPTKCEAAKRARHRARHARHTKNKKN